MASFVTVRAPFATDGVQINGQDMRLGVSTFLMAPDGVLYGRAGVRPSGFATPLKILQNTSPSMHILVKAGMCMVQANAAGVANTQGMYPMVLTSDAVLDVATAPSSPNSRRDRVVAQVVDIGTSGTTYQVRVITGTAGTSPAAPAVPDTALNLGQFLVGTGVTSIVNANITDERVFTTGLGGITPAATATRPTNPFDGMSIYATDSETVLVSQTGVWKFLGYTKTYGGNVRYDRTATMNVANVTTTNLQFTGSSPDTDVDVVATSSNSIFTMQRTGKWLWIVNCPFGANAGGNARWLWLHQGGSPNVRYATVSNPNVGAGFGNSHQQVAIVRRFAAGDSITASTFQDSGNTVVISPDATGTGPCNIYGQYLGS